MRQRTALLCLLACTTPNATPTIGLKSRMSRVRQRERQMRAFKSVAHAQRFWVDTRSHPESLPNRTPPATVSQPAPLMISLLPCLARGNVCLMNREVSHKPSQPHSNDAKLTVPWRHISFCQVAAPISVKDGVLTAATAVVIRPGKIDRSPCDTGCSARMAVLHAKHRMKVGDRFLGTSIIGTEFDCRIDSERSFGRRTGISPII